MCFICLTKAFDRIQLKDIIDILQDKGINHNWIELIKNLNNKCTTQIKVGHMRSEEVKLNSRIRQGDSQSFPFQTNYG